MWHIIINPFNREHLPAWLIFIGVLNAFVINILHINIFLLSFFIVIDLIYLLLKHLKQSILKLNPFVITLTAALTSFILFAIYISHENMKQAVMFITGVAYILWGYYAAQGFKINFTSFSFSVWMYLAGTWFLYLFYWQPVAEFFYSDPTYNMLGLKTFGIIRSYGLIFSPLTNGYLLLTIFYIYFFYSPRSLFLMLVILLTLATTLVRGAFLSIIFFFFIYLISQRRIVLLLTMSALFCLAYFSLPEVKLVLDSIITQQDSAGSAQKHANDLFFALEQIPLNPIGLGFSENAWVESWWLEVVLITGWFGGLFFVLLFSYLIFKILLTRQLVKSVAAISFVSPAIVIPFYTFNLAFLLFWFLMFLFYHDTQEKWKLKVTI